MSGMSKAAFAAMALMVATAAFLVTGCGSGAASDGPDESMRREGSALFGGPGGRSGEARGEEAGSARAGSSTGATKIARANRWSIVLATFRGEGQMEAARIALRRMQTEGRLPEAYLERRGPATTIAYGGYSGPDDSQAQRDLKRIQQMEFNGLRPYWIAYLAPPYTGTIIGEHPEYNLLNAKARFGRHALYTLQVGAYGREDLEYPTEEELAESRRKAEEAAALLRQEGEAAFYYHGRRLSMVTVGVFDSSDFDPEVPGMQSQRLRQARERHPYNLYNGQGVRTRVGGAAGEWRMQPSTLVNIPEK